MDASTQVAKKNVADVVLDGAEPNWSSWDEADRAELVTRLLEKFQSKLRHYGVPWRNVRDHVDQWYPKYKGYLYTHLTGFKELGEEFIFLSDLDEHQCGTAVAADESSEDQVGPFVTETTLILTKGGELGEFSITKYLNCPEDLEKDPIDNFDLIRDFRHLVTEIRPLNNGEVEGWANTPGILEDILESLEDIVLQSVRVKTQRLQKDQEDLQTIRNIRSRFETLGLSA